MHALSAPGSALAADLAPTRELFADADVADPDTPMCTAFGGVCHIGAELRG